MGAPKLVEVSSEGVIIHLTECWRVAQGGENAVQTSSPCLAIKALHGLVSTYPASSPTSLCLLSHLPWVSTVSPCVPDYALHSWTSQPGSALSSASVAECKNGHNDVFSSLDPHPSRTWLFIVFRQEVEFLCTPLIWAGLVACLGQREPREVR